MLPMMLINTCVLEGSWSRCFQMQSSQVKSYFIQTTFDTNAEGFTGS